MKIFLKSLIFIFLKIINILFFSFIKKNVILFYGTNYKYIDNPRYLFEFVSKKQSHLSFIWVSYGKNISNYLNKKNLNYTKINSILYFYYFLKTKAIIGSGMNIPPIFKNREDNKSVSAETP